MARRITVRNQDELKRVLESETKAVVNAINNAEKHGLGIITNEFVKDANSYAPLDQGILRASAIINTIYNKGLAIWKTPYAERLWYGDTFNFSKDSNPNAQSRWGDVAWAKNIKKYKKMYLQIFRREWGR